MTKTLIEVIEAKETLFFSRQDGAMRQWIDVTIASGFSQAVLAEATIRARGEEVATPITLQSGTGVYRCYAPALWPDKPPEDAALLRIEAAGQEIESACPVGHHRPWVVYVLSDVCTDDTWVYADHDSLRKDDADLTAAELALAQATRCAPEANRNHYNLVHALELEYFEEFYPERVDQLAEAMRREEITLNPFFNMTLSIPISLEEQIRLFYKAREWVLKYGIAMKYANHQETPNIAWDMASILAGCGIQYLVKGILPYECPWAARLEEPPVFQWEGPDGARIWMRRRNSDYSEGHFILNGLEETNRGLHEKVIPEFSAWSERYPFNAIGLVGCYGDLIPAQPGQYQSRDLPLLKAASVARYNDQGWDYPRLVNGSHAQFWQDIERQVAERGIQPELYRGDYGLGWDAWPACLAYDAAGWRRAQERAALADKLAALLTRLDPAWFQQYRAGLTAGWKNLKLLADHAWNGANDANRLLNAQLRRQWQTAANAAFDNVISCGLEALAKQVSTPAGENLLVFNGLGWQRDGLVRVRAARTAAQVIDPRDGQSLPCQVDPDTGDLLFLARAVPAVGYQTYRLSEGAAPQTALPWKITGSSLEGPFYRIEVSPVTGGITRLYDKVRGIELVDPASPYTLNQCLYYSDSPVDPARSYPVLHPPKADRGSEHTPVSAVIAAGPAGALCASLIVTTSLKEIHLKSTITLYSHLDRIDIRNELAKPTTAERQQLDFVFPFRVPERELRVEYPGVILDPEKEMRPGAGLSAMALRHFVDVFNQEYGVTLTMADSFIIQFGRRTTTEDPRQIDPSATIFAMVMGNIYDANEAILDQAGVENFTYRFSLRGHAGGFNPASAVHFGWEDNNPLEAVALAPHQAGILRERQKSLISVQPETAILTCLKPGEEIGLVARVWDCAGEGGPAIVDLDVPSAPAWAVLTDHLERDLHPLEVQNETVSVPLRPRGVTTARFEW